MGGQVRPDSDGRAGSAGFGRADLAGFWRAVCCKGEDPRGCESNCVFHVFWGRFLCVFGHRFLPFSERCFRVSELICSIPLPGQKHFFTVFCTFFYSCLLRFLCVFGPGPRQSRQPEKKLHEVCFLTKHIRMRAPLKGVGRNTSETCVCKKYTPQDNRTMLEW